MAFQLEGIGSGGYRSVVALFAQQLLEGLLIVGGYGVLYLKARKFIRNHLFGKSLTNPKDSIIPHNSLQLEMAKIILDNLTAGSSTITTIDRGIPQTKDYIRLQNARAFRPSYQASMQSIKFSFPKVAAETNAGGLKLIFLSRTCNNDPKYQFANVAQPGFKHYKPNSMACSPVSFHEFKP